MEENKEVKRLSKTAIAEYQDKLDELKNVTRLEVAQQIKEARAFGDISENAEYDAAMDHQARIEYEIAQLEELLANVEEIDEESIDLSSVNVGGRVRLTCLNDDSVDQYDIVSTTEVEPFARRIKIECSDAPHNMEIGYQVGQIVEFVLPPKLSDESPLGQSLVGAKQGEDVQIITPNGKMMKYHIDEILKAQELPRGKVVAEEILMESPIYS